jgi:hypothetical protein
MDSDQGRVETEAPTDDPVETPAPEAAAATPAEPAADESPLEAPFKLEDAPEDVREYLQRMDRQYKAEFTRKTQELGRERSEFEQERDRVKEALDLQARLSGDEDTALETLNELAERLGFEPNGQDDQQARQPDPTDELRQRLERIEAGKAEEQLGNQRQLIRDHVEDAIDEMVGDGPKLGDVEREVIIGTAFALPAKGGLPDMEGAIVRFEALEAAAVERYLKSKGGSSIELPGGSGVEEFDTSTDAGRLAMANQIAERRLAAQQ